MNRIARWLGIIGLGAADCVILNLCLPLMEGNKDGKTGAVVAGILALAILGVVGALADTED